MGNHEATGGILRTQAFLLFYLVYLLTWYTWSDYPSSPTGRDLNIRLKASSEGAATISSGRPFQESTTLFEKKYFRMLVRTLGFCSLSE